MSRKRRVAGRLCILARSDALTMRRLIATIVVFAQISVFNTADAVFELLTARDSVGIPLAGRRARARHHFARKMSKSGVNSNSIRVHFIRFFLCVLCPQPAPNLPPDVENLHFLRFRFSNKWGQNGDGSMDKNTIKK